MVDERVLLTAMLRGRGLAAAGEDAQLELMAGGYRNRVYRWRRSPLLLDAVVKVFVDAPENPLFPTLPDHEAAALALLRGRSIAPELIAHEVDARIGHVLVYFMVAGAPWSHDTASVGRLLRQIHDVDVESTDLPAGFTFRTLASRPRDVAGQAVSIVDRIDDASLARRIRRLIEHTYRAANGDTDATDAGRLRLVHTDPGPGNVIVGSDGPRMIDWQCPGLGDPVEDLAGFASPAIQILYEHEPLTESEVADLLHGYDQASTTDRFERLAPLYRARIAAYCGYRMLALADSEPELSARYARALQAELAGLNG